MVGHTERAAEYRRKAEQLRATIQDVKDQESRDAIEKIAAGYEQLARIQKNLAKADEAIGKR
ncbi:MAG TPA: hypothetical protein VFW28_05335 [Micropepsaceae bacterium]|nr:hypothetical protein [Micropepsaceae bacterium]